MNRYITALITVVGIVLAPDNSKAAEWSVQSSATRVSLIELYTSEGCSSCPPAEAWLSGLRSEKGLWTAFVPVAFHVNYWDDLGWPDKFASGEFTQRQRGYAGEWKAENVYTPELVVSGREAKMFELPVAGSVQAGVVSATLNDQRELTVRYQRLEAGKDWKAHVALLGFDIDMAVKRGENAGRTLRHDFTVLVLKSTALKAGVATIPLDAAKPGEKGIAIWVTEAGKLTPVQATGGWLK